MIGRIFEMSRGQDFFGCSQDVFHRNQSDENEFCSQENWQGAVICLAQVNHNHNFISHCEAILNLKWLKNKDIFDEYIQVHGSFNLGVFKV